MGLFTKSELCDAMKAAILYTKRQAWKHNKSSVFPAVDDKRRDEDLQCCTHVSKKNMKVHRCTKKHMLWVYSNVSFYDFENALVKLYKCRKV